MAATMYIVVEGDDPGFDIFVNGRALARNEEPLEKLARSIGVRPLIEYFSADQNSMALLIEEGAGDASLMDRLPPPQWFDPQDGLATVEALILRLRVEPAELGSESPLIREELEEYASVLRKSAQRNLRWHLAVSWR